MQDRGITVFWHYSLYLAKRQFLHLYSSKWNSFLKLINIIFEDKMGHKAWHFIKFNMSHIIALSDIKFNFFTFLFSCLISVYLQETIFTCILEKWYVPWVRHTWSSFLVLGIETGPSYWDMSPGFSKYFHLFM